MAVSGNSFLTLAAAKTYLNITGSSLDTVVEGAVNGAIGIMERFTNRKLRTREYRSAADKLRADGSGSNWIVSPQWPVTDLTTIARIEPNGDQTLLDISVNRVTKAGVIYLDTDIFVRGKSNHLIECDAGYRSIGEEDDVAALELAQKRLVQVLFQDQQNATGRGTSFAISGESIGLIETKLPADVEAILRNFARVM